MAARLPAFSEADEGKSLPTLGRDEYGVEGEVVECCSKALGVESIQLMIRIGVLSCFRGQRLGA